MLQVMRDLAHTRMVKGLMVLLVVSFGIWGIGDIFRGNPMQRTVAKAGEAQITVQELNRNFDEAMVRARKIMGPDFDVKQARQAGILDNTLEEMIDRLLLDQDLRRLGLDASPQAVLDMLAAQPQFRKPDGSFNKDLLAEMLQQQHLSEHDFIQEGRKDLARQQLLNVFTDGMNAPQTMISALYQARGQQRILDVVTIKNDSVRDIPAPDDKALRAFYEANPKIFTAPEYRAITLAHLSTADVAKDIRISDDQVKKEYDARGDQLMTPERRDIIQVVMQNEDKARQLAAVTKASGNLVETAKAMGYNVVPLNQTEEKSLLPELAKPVFALPAGQVSNVIKSALGWHVVQVKKITPSGKPTLGNIKDQLRDEMQRDQAIEASTRLVNQLDDELAAGHTLEDIADGLKLRLIKIPELDAEGKRPDGKEPAEFPNKKDALKTAFGQSAGETGPVMDDRNGNYTVVRTDEITPSAVKPFEVVKDQVASAWKAQEQAKRAALKAEDIARSLREGKLASAFAGNGVTVRESKPLSLLGGSDPDLPVSVLPQIFRLKKGEATTVAAPDEQLVLRLAKIVDVDPTAGGAARNQISATLNRDMPQELAAQYLKYLPVVFPVKINRDVFNDVARQGGG